MRLLALVLSVAAGCAPPSLAAEVRVPVTEIPTFHIGSTATTFSVVLGDVSGQQSRPCVAALPDLSAKLDGVDVPVVTYGGKIGEQPGDDVADNDCAAPRLSLVAPPLSHTAQLELTDHGGTVRCDLPDLATVRTATLVPAGPWVLSSGAAVTLQWSPGSDLALRGIKVVMEDFKGGVLVAVTDILGVVVNSDRLMFTLPQVRPGSYDLELSPVAALSCTPGPGRVDLRTGPQFGISQPITIVP